MSYYMKELEKMVSKRDDIAERYDTDDSEVFPFVWNRLQEALLEGIEILSEGMDYPEFVFHDTLAASRLHFGETLENHRLPTAAAACGYDLDDHHHALADAEACAWIAREIL